MVRIDSITFAEPRVCGPINQYPFQRKIHKGHQENTRAIINRINQGIKFLYKRRQHFNQQLYRMHLEG